MNLFDSFVALLLAAVAWAVFGFVTGALVHQALFSMAATPM